MQEDSYDRLFYESLEDSDVFDFNDCPYDCDVDDKIDINGVHEVP
jgi:hypothetical protein